MKIGDKVTVIIEGPDKGKTGVIIREDDAHDSEIQNGYKMFYKIAFPNDYTLWFGDNDLKMSQLPKKKDLLNLNK